MSKVVIQSRHVQPNKPKVSITIAASLLEKIDERARELDLSRSTVIQMALREHFAK